MDLTVLRELIATLLGNSTLQNEALIVANAVMNTFRKNDPSPETHRLSTIVVVPLNERNFAHITAQERCGPS
jgi:hypothetical protein